MTDDPNTRDRQTLGRRIGVVLWWSAVLLIAPPAATVTSGLATGMDGTCYPGPTRLDCVLTSWFVAAIAIPTIVVAVLWSGARALACGGSGPSAGLRMLWAHVAVVAVLAAAYVAALVATSLEDFGSVGGSLLLAVGGMPLLDLGLPWSLTHMPSLSLTGVWGDVAGHATTVVPAVLNVALHAAVRRAWRRRSVRSAAAACGPSGIG